MHVCAFVCTSLSACVYLCLFAFLCVYLSVVLSLCLSVCLCLSVYASVCLCLCVQLCGCVCGYDCVFVCLCTCLFLCTSVSTCVCYKSLLSFALEKVEGWTVCVLRKEREQWKTVVISCWLSHGHLKHLMVSWTSSCIFCCYNRMHETRSCMNNRSLFLTILDAGKSWTRCQHLEREGLFAASLCDGRYHVSGSTAGRQKCS